MGKINEYFVLGAMSGTSLDGLDLAACRFYFHDNKWEYEIISAVTFSYNNEWLQLLTKAASNSVIDFLLLHNSYGKFIGQRINDFLKKNNCKIDFISSHGHTVFHQPEKQLTTQIGNGAFIAAETGITTISDFRTMDVAMGGQGAPLVPIGDRLLFADFEYCLNLGGFANISFEENGLRRAYDICPVNIILNHVSKKMGFEYDKDGEFGRSGNIINSLLEFLNKIEYYSLAYPKSLGKEWLDKEIISKIDSLDIAPVDVMRTLYEHMAIQITSSFSGSEKGKVLVTGGGAYNKFLIELIRSKTKHEIVIPEPRIIEFKEALIFAFLGVLKYRNEINCLASVTGASADNVGGVINYRHANSVAS